MAKPITLEEFARRCEKAWEKQSSHAIRYYGSDADSLDSKFRLQWLAQSARNLNNQSGGKLRLVCPNDFP